MYVIGDIHGDLQWYFKTIKDLDESIQVGDFGAGFVYLPDKWDDNHKFIRGNHDNPEICKAHPNYLGDFGLLQYKEYTILYVSGAESTDKSSRYEYIDWWRDEELTYWQTMSLAALIANINIDIVISHDRPYMLNPRQYKKSNTGRVLQRLYEEKRPSLWIYGHHHISETKFVDNTTMFIGLAEKEIFEI